MPPKKGAKGGDVELPPRVLAAWRADSSPSDDEVTALVESDGECTCVACVHMHGVRGVHVMARQGVGMRTMRRMGPSA